MRREAPLLSYVDASYSRESGNLLAAGSYAKVSRRRGRGRRYRADWIPAYAGRAVMGVGWRFNGRCIRVHRIGVGAAAAPSDGAGIVMETYAQSEWSVS